MKLRYNLTGNRYGNLIVLGYSHTNYRTFWDCICDCGNKVKVAANGLRSGNTKSCGCFQKMQTSKANTRHKEHGTKLYSIWGGIIQRVSNPNNKRHKIYKNISVCDAWRQYLNFKDWAINNGYKEGLQIDRIDNDGDYCPENCQWLTASQHAKKTNFNRWSKQGVH